MLDVNWVWGTALLYIAFLFLVAYYADQRQKAGRSVTANAWVYALSIAVYATSWTFYGSVGKAATTGIDFLPVYLGPTLTAFSWWFLLKKMVRISKENNITSIADFISSRYGSSQWLGAIITVITLMGVMPYIALQLKAVSTSFTIITGYHDFHVGFMDRVYIPSPHPGLFTAIFLAVFSVLFGARHLISTERHDGLVAAIALESLVKLMAMLTVGVCITYIAFNGMGDIFQRLHQKDPQLLARLTTLGERGDNSYASMFSILTLSMGAVMLLPRQFQIMVLENAHESHLNTASWRFPAYMFLMNLFVMPIALAGILMNGNSTQADYFVLTLPMQLGYPWIALVAFLGGFSASAGMVMVESIAVSTMLLNHVLLPVVIRLKPRTWFPQLLINLKRFGIVLVILLGYLYQSVVGESYMLANMGLISFSAAIQFAPALVGGLYWPRGNKAGAIVGLLAGFAVWFYTLLLPSLLRAGGEPSDFLLDGPFGIALLRPQELFGLTGLDPYTHTLFWSMFMNIAAYLSLSILLGQGEKEREQVNRFVSVFTPESATPHWETKRLSKPVTIVQFVNLMTKFIGEQQANAAITDYLGDREIDSKGGVSEFELPNLKRFVEKTLAGSLGGAAAGAVVESFLSDIGSRMEPVFDIFSTVRTSRDQSREALFVRLRASMIMNRSLELDIIMGDLLELLLREFKLDLAVIRLLNDESVLQVRCFRGIGGERLTAEDRLLEIDTHVGEAFLGCRTEFFNDTTFITKPIAKEIFRREGIKSFAHIPIVSEGANPVGILSVFSRSIVGLFTEQFVELLESLAGQLAQAVRIVEEREAKEKERRQKEAALLENARVTRDLELAKQIQLSLLPEKPPTLPGVSIACRCVPAAHVGGDYYDFFERERQVVDLVMADVSGHSVGAALIMVETRSVLRAQIKEPRSARDLLTLLNELLYDDLTGAELFITMFCARYDSATRMLRYANAGHTRPLLFRAGSWTELDAEGLILGVERKVVFEEQRISLQAGDLLFIYTDGIIEAENQAGELFGIPRLCELLSPLSDRDPEELIEKVLSEVSSYAWPQPLQDDISMVVMKVD
ncbi:SpoIIE family protein phosphatase [Geomonas subterranea]|uniref:SpoIIE family protein phosphatase n=1 Tax=Geomonas subterranea TaxID=2847989 RepID=A0ABX8LQ46_9BACT|nr:SpoIIE family protein phosphatase [Geomonas subterranea]QXE92378.1 SpoIIE family protein phosphatase [Geomonas subterranea]QXM09523.1 SpoIIE family protein phosphatase [Geomonas subterranea]